jgi:hypothetical protein
MAGDRGCRDGRSAHDLVVSEVDRCRRLSFSLGWCELLEESVWSGGVEMPQIRGKDTTQVALVDDQQPVAQLTAKTSDHPFADRIRAGRWGRAGEDVNALGGEHRVERTTEPRVPVP